MTTDRVLVFGAAGHISLPLVRWIAYKSPGTQLRLVSRNPEQRSSLARQFPNAEVMAVDYLDPAGMGAALQGVTAVFVVTPDFLDEQRAMENLAEAARAAGDVRQIVRVIGNLPNVKPSDIPEDMRSAGGTATQHFVAQSVLDASGLPVTYLNIPAYLMDDLFRWGGPIRDQSLLVMPYDRRHAWVDPAEVGEAAARIILSRDERHAGVQYNVESGKDLLKFGDVAAMLSDVLQREIRYDGTTETWRKLMGARYNQLFKGVGEAYYLKFYEFEQKHELAVCTSDTLANLLQRPPLTLRAWMQINAGGLQPRSETRG